MRPALLTLFASLFLLLLVPATSVRSVEPTAPGDLDPTFGNGGFAITTVNADAGDEIIALARMSDGDIVAAGFQEIELYPTMWIKRLVVTRHRSNGILDTSFGTNGVVILDSMFEVWDVKVTPNDRILVYLNSSHPEYPHHFSGLLIQLLPTGVLDLSFGTNGRVFVTANDISAGRGRLTVDQQGRPVLAYSTATGTHVERLLPDGSHDPSFGVNGRRTLVFQWRQSPSDDLMIQPDGRIIVGGVAIGTQSNTYRIAAARLLADGSLDPSFGTGGIVESDFGFLNPNPHSFFLLPEGRILVLWIGTSGGNYVHRLLRLNANGTLDMTYGSGGYVTLPTFPQVSYFTDAALTQTGELVLIGPHYPTQGVNVTTAVVQVLPNGQPDSRFGTNGVSVVTPYSSSSQAYALHVLPDNRILAGGYMRAAAGQPYYGADFLMFRLTNVPPQYNHALSLPLILTR